MVAKTEHKKRTGCPIACALDIVGDHWTLLIIRNLMFIGRHEYKDMLAAEELISSSILTDRLKKLEQSGLIAAITHPDNKRRKIYYLTEMGKDLIDVMLALIRWSVAHMREHLDIPSEQRLMLESDPDGFRRMTLNRLKAWEKENLSTP